MVVPHHLDAMHKFEGLNRDQELDKVEFDSWRMIKYNLSLLRAT